jgi:hypothetical protein
MKTAVFIPPMLATRLEDPRRLADPRYVAEPKLDGQRVQLHVRGHRTDHAFSRPGRELIGLSGLAWLREVRWPIASAVLDGEAVAGDGSEGIQAVFEARNRHGSPMAFTAFDLLELDGQSVMGEAWTVRRKRLEDLLEPPPLGICLVPVTDDAPALWDAWVGMGGEGIVLKERLSLYRPVVRSPAWLKLKPKLSLDAVVTGGSSQRICVWGGGHVAVDNEVLCHLRSKVDVRVIAATNQDLERAVRAGRFREDLYYRLNTVHLVLPPLRERSGDVVILAEHFLAEACERFHRPIKWFTADAQAALVRNYWPGNVLELQNRVRRAVVLIEESAITAELLELEEPPR